jgi:lysine-specific demethylase 8
MKRNTSLSRQFQFWRFLDHLIGGNAPAQRFALQRQKLIERHVAQHERSSILTPVREVDRVRNISDVELRDTYVRNGIPVVLEGKAKDWPCVQKWSLDWLYDNYCEDKVALFDPLSTEAEEVNYEVEETNLKDVLDAMKTGETSKYSRFNRILYDHPELVDDFDWKWLYKSRNKVSSGKTFQVFIGGKGTQTSLHCAGEHNLFTQVHGSKHWHLFPPNSDMLLDPPITRSPYFYSRFDPDSPDFKAFPAAKFLNAWECVLNPGDVLFNPPFWWHQVKNMSHSIGVGFRWFSPQDSLKASAAGTLMTLLSTTPPIWTATKHRTDFARIFNHMNTKR